MGEHVVHLLSRRSALRERQDGASAVEFALIFPVLILLLGGVVEGSLLLYTWGNMEHIGRQAARAVAIGEATTDEARQFIFERMKQSIGSPNVTASLTTRSGASSLEDEIIVQVSVPGPELATLLPFGIFRNINLTSTVRVHDEN